MAELRMDVHEIDAVKGVKRIAALFEMLNSGVTFEATFYIGGQVQDVVVYFSDGAWRFEVIKYVGPNAERVPTVHGRDLGLRP